MLLLGLSGTTLHANLLVLFLRDVKYLLLICVDEDDKLQANLRAFLVGCFRVTVCIYPLA
jgi:hypothetical protein